MAADSPKVPLIKQKMCDQLWNCSLTIIPFPLTSGEQCSIRAYEEQREY